MSHTATVTVTCPKCGKNHPFEIWDSVNTVLDPDMKEKVASGEIFRFVCPSCGAETRVNYSLLYHQMDDRIMIQFAPDEKIAEEYKKIISGPVKAMVGMFVEFWDSHYLTRIVRTIFGLQEKIQIFDAGLDDRIVEIFKLLLLYQTVQPDLFDETELYYFRDDGTDYVQVIMENAPAGSFEMTPEVYEKLAQDFMPKLPDIRDAEPEIDRTWALEFMRHAAA